MPVRSLNSSVLKWPDRVAVDRAARLWAAAQRQLHPEIVRVGYFGSYALGDWGVGSDLDLVVIVDRCERVFTERPLDWDTSTLPVPAEILAYIRDEWERLLAGANGFVEAVSRQVVWL